MCNALNPWILSDGVPIFNKQQQVQSLRVAARAASGTWAQIWKGQSAKRRLSGDGDGDGDSDNGEDATGGARKISRNDDLAGIAFAGVGSVASSSGRAGTGSEITGRKRAGEGSPAACGLKKLRLDSVCESPPEEGVAEVLQRLKEENEQSKQLRNSMVDSMTKK
jgi:hypothetical protein